LKEEKLHIYHYTAPITVACNIYEKKTILRGKYFARISSRRAEDPEFPFYVIFSDESLFIREGVLNSHNMHIWDDENPRVTLRNFQIRWKLNVWAGIMGTKILGPVIPLERLNGALYVKFLVENLPDFLEDVPLLDRNKIIFQ